MSLWSSLLQTYDAVNSSAGITPLNEDVNKTLLPLYHTTLKTQHLTSRNRLAKRMEISAY